MANIPAVDAVSSLLFDYTGRKITRVKKRGLKFAHYTTAEVGAKILLNRDIWMRNAATMNDFREVAYGADSLKAALRQFGARFRAALDVVEPGLCTSILEWMERADFNHHQHSYMTSITEHRPSDDIGLLSMWRAYGGPVAGVALIFNADFLDADSTPLQAWSSPVMYGEMAYLRDFEGLVTRLENNSALLHAVGAEQLKPMVFNALQFSILSTKHVGFREEREWRVIHQPREQASAWIQPTFETIRGKPEVVYHVPLHNAEGMNMPEVDLSRLLNKIIIGPCQNPYQVAGLFEDILRSMNFDNPDRYIRLSLIPLRQQG